MGVLEIEVGVLGVCDEEFKVGVRPGECSGVLLSDALRGEWQGVLAMEIGVLGDWKGLLLVEVGDRGEGVLSEFVRGECNKGETLPGGLEILKIFFKKLLLRGICS